MGDTFWYAYGGDVSGPFFETKADAADACDDGETPRPVAGAVIDTNGEGGESGGDGDTALDDMSHDELKAEAELRGIADETDLRSRASIREALRDADA
ncbi:hypothetical protein [Natronomonas sp.]|jgi:hypothetical protein|uniref:hypothetical protein n=1 Tax=Natronomonas sp. TaxID=2184060 RepID=UPI003989378D